MTVCFLVRDKKGVNPIGKGGGEELGGVERKKHNQNILYERNLLSVKENKWIVLTSLQVKLLVPSVCPLVCFGRGGG